ncbi:hypothetical protein N8Z76_01180 [Gammaproteobacteria bacterium]|nr:hypothetical protein [Gammaproteobacteria bacterium]
MSIIILVAIYLLYRSLKGSEQIDLAHTLEKMRAKNASSSKKVQAKKALSHIPDGKLIRSRLVGNLLDYERAFEETERSVYSFLRYRGVDGLVKLHDWLSGMEEASIAIENFSPYSNLDIYTIYHIEKIALYKDAVYEFALLEDLKYVEYCKRDMEDALKRSKTEIDFLRDYSDMTEFFEDSYERQAHWGKNEEDRRSKFDQLDKAANEKAEVPKCLKGEREIKKVLKN